jgi:hypothetical protein
MLRVSKPSQHSVKLGMRASGARSEWPRRRDEAARWISMVACDERYTSNVGEDVGRDACVVWWSHMVVTLLARGYLPACSSRQASLKKKPINVSRKWTTNNELDAPNGVSLHSPASRVARSPPCSAYHTALVVCPSTVDPEAWEVP